jgi:hypothetical protein
MFALGKKADVRGVYTRERISSDGPSVTTFFGDGHVDRREIADAMLVQAEEDWISWFDCCLQ